MNTKLMAIAGASVVGLILVYVLGGSLGFGGNSADNFIKSIEEAVEKERSKYSLYGLYPGMSRHELGRVAVRDSSQEVNIYPDTSHTIQYKITDPDTNIRSNFQYVKDAEYQMKGKSNDKATYASDISIERSYVGYRFESSVLVKDIKAVFGEPQGYHEQYGMTSMTYKTRGPTDQQLHNACFEQVQKAGHDVSKGYDVINKMKAIDYSFGVDTVEMVQKYCPDALPLYKEYIVSKIGPTIEFRLQPNQKRLAIAMRYKAVGVFAMMANKKYSAVIQNQQSYQQPDLSDVSKGSARLK